MATITTTGDLNGFPLDLTLDPSKSNLRNGQRCAARPVSALEQAAQYLEGARKISIPAISTPIGALGSITVQLGRIPVDVFSDIVTIMGFVSTNDEEGGATLTVTTSNGSESLTIPGSIDLNGILNAVKFTISPTITLLTKANAPGLEDIELTITPVAPAALVGLWSLTIIVEPARTIP